MKIDIAKPLATNGAGLEKDVRTLKIALNRLGYYQPHPETGITEISDKAMFAGLRRFQKNHGLSISGSIKPGDATLSALNIAISNQDKGSQYIWHTMLDNRVRPSHLVREGQVFSWADHPWPGEEPNCRCWAGQIAENQIRENSATDHGKQRKSERKISDSEIRSAIKSAESNGNVTSKTGKYGTEQKVYKGDNGVVVIIETEGRNSGKIITVWRE